MTDTDDGFGPVQRGRAGLRPKPLEPGPRPAPASGDDYGPVVTGRRGRRRAGRAARWLVMLLVLVLLAIPAVGGSLLLYSSARLERAPVGGLARVSGQMNVLLVGSDSREGLSPEELEALGTHAVSGQRTDTILLLSIAGGRAAMLAFPRDLFVTRCDGTRGRINSAYALGGPSCLVETVTALSGIPISHYAEVNFAGFIRVIDALGGVGIHLDEPLVDRYAGIDLPAGCNRLTGAQALGFVRARKIDSDLGRIGRQQRLLSEVSKEVTSPATLVNVPRLFSVAGNAADAVTVNEDFGVTDLLRFARGARGLAGAGVATYAVPVQGQRIGGAAVLVPIEGEAEAVFTQFRSGTVLRPPRSSAPGEITVVVLNGGRIQGLAARGRDYLTERGFVVVEIGNANPVARTIVRHAPSDEAAAQVVAEHLGGAPLEAGPPGSPLTAVLGPDAASLGEAPPPADQRPPAEEAPPGAGAPEPAPEEC